MLKDLWRNGRAMIAQLRLNVFIADFNPLAVLIVEAAALASGAKGAGLAGVL